MNKQQFDAGVLAQIDTIRRIGRGRLRSMSDLDDFTQEVVIRLYAGRDQLRDSGRIAQWTAVTAKNLAVQWNRKRTPLLMPALPEVAVGPQSDADPSLRAERWRELVNALGALDPVERDLLVSYYVDEIGYAELQRRHGLSYSAVGVRLHRAKRKLRRRLGWITAAIAACFHTPNVRAFGGQPMALSRMSTAFIAGIGVTVTGAIGFGWAMSTDADAADPADDNLIFVEVQVQTSDAAESRDQDRLHLQEAREQSAAEPDREGDLDLHFEDVDRDVQARDSDARGELHGGGPFPDHETALRAKQEFDRNVEAYREEHGEYPPNFELHLERHTIVLGIAAYLAEHGEYPPNVEDELRAHEAHVAAARPSDARPHVAVRHERHLHIETTPDDNR